MTSDPSDRTDDTPRPEQAPTPPARSRKKGKGRRNIPGGAIPGARIDRSAPRHQARVLAMQALYEHDLTDHDIDEILERLRGDEDEDDVPPPVAERVVHLVRGVIDRQDALDPHIAAAAPQFPIPQLAAVDRNVLRLAVYELYHAPDVPYKVVINEAVEIAKRFGGPNSGRFVNGVLGTIVDRLPAERKAKASG